MKLRTRRTSGGRIASGALLAMFALLSLLLYAPAFEGPFFGDDVHYLGANPYVREASPGLMLELFDPSGEAPVFVGNYAPVHVLLHALEWQMFGTEVRAYHVVNALLHAGNAFLLSLLLAGAGVGMGAAVGGGLFFLVHPANVEAVAWISQLKTVASLLLALLALGLLGSRPVLASVAFTAGLLTKATTACVVPAAAALAWVQASQASEPSENARRGAWLWPALWFGVLALYSLAQVAAFQSSSVLVEPVDAEPGVRLRTAAALFMRYLAMAATSYGVSAFQEPRPATSIWDPWWLAGLASALLIAGRAVWALRRRRQEAVWWIWALASFVPVSQLFPFRFPLADRYVYFILPGLIGGALLALPSLAPSRVWRSRLVTAVAAVALAALAVRSHARADLWSHPPKLLADAALHYPDGVSAHLLRARFAAEAGNLDAGMASLEAAYERGFDRFDQLMGDVAMDRLADHPGYRPLVAKMATRWIHRIEAIERPSQSQLFSLAMAYRVLGELQEARLALEEVLRQGGPLDAAAQAALAALPPPRVHPGAPPDPDDP